MAAPDTFGLAVLSIVNTYLGAGVTPFTIAASGSDLALKPRFIHVSGAAGSVTYVANGVIITEVLEVGYHPIRPDRVTAIAGGTVLVGWL